MKTTWLAVVPLLLVAACSSPAPPPAAAPAPSPAPPSSPSSPSSPAASASLVPVDPGDLVARDDARLYGAAVTRRGGRLEVATVWEVRDEGRRYAVARSSDGFATATHELIRSRDVPAVLSPPPPAGAPTTAPCPPVRGGVVLCVDHQPPRAAWTADAGVSWQQRRLDLDRLLLESVPSLREDTFAVVGGGDGATLFPFQRVARSTDGGETWATYDLPLLDGARAYTSGQVVLADGRLVAALTGFSDDRPHRPASRPHGLWVSDGDDWTSFSPFEPRFVPPLPATASYGPIESIDATIDPDPVVLVHAHVGGTRRVYASSDGARVFREVRVR